MKRNALVFALLVSLVLGATASEASAAEKPTVKWLVPPGLWILPPIPIVPPDPIIPPDDIVPPDPVKPRG